jgi:perosamine synthetase
MKRIPVSGPWVTDKEIAYVTDAATNAWFDKANVYNEKFESAFAEYIGVPFAISLPSCTSAIHLSLLANGIGPGDEVIVPDVTWIATSAPIKYVGATPVFADIDPATWCISTDSIQERITDNTRAIIPVDLYGSMPDMQAIKNLSDKHNLFVIEDAAEAFGSELLGKKAGSFGNTGVFSFHGSKTMTTGEGGMLVTADQLLFERILFLRDHGRKPGDTTFRNTEVGYKYKMSSLQAAFGLAQVERADQLIHRKQEIFCWYHQYLGEIQGISLNADIPNGVNSYWMVTVVFDSSFNTDKFDVIDKMSHHGIDCRPFFSPLSSLDAYHEIATKHDYAFLNPVSYAISQQGINLPSGYNLTHEDVNYCCDCLLDILQS